MSKNFDKETLRILRTKMQIALDEAGLGFEINVGNCSFNPTEATFKVTVKTEGAKEARTEQAVSYAKMFGLQSVEANGYKIVDYHSRKRNYPFIVEKGEKRYKMSIEQVQSIFGVAK